MVVGANVIDREADRVQSVWRSEVDEFNDRDLYLVKDALGRVVTFPLAERVCRDGPYRLVPSMIVQLVTAM